MASALTMARTAPHTEVGGMIVPAKMAQSLRPNLIKSSTTMRNIGASSKFCSNSPAGEQGRGAHPPASEASEGASDTLPYYPATATLQTELKGTAPSILCFAGARQLLAADLVAMAWR